MVKKLYSQTLGILIEDKYDPNDSAVSVASKKGGNNFK